MKVVGLNSSDNQQCFKSLWVGQPFEFSEIVYLKINNLKDGNAVDLSDGFTSSFREGCMVTPVICEVQVLRKGCIDDN